MRREVEQLSDAPPERVDGSLFGLTQKCLELRKILLDWIEVGRIGRQVDEPGASRFDHLANAIDFVGSEVIHDHDILGLQGRAQTSGDIDAEDLTVHRLIDHEGRNDLITAQAGDKGRRLPMAVRHFADHPLADRTSPIGARHVGCGAALVDEDEFLRIKSVLIFSPNRARQGDVRPVLLGCVYHLFFCN